MKLYRVSYIIFIIVPSYVQMTLFEQMLPFLVDGQIIVNMPGNFASVCFQEKLCESVKYREKNLIFLDAISMPFASRVISPGKVLIAGIKQQLKLGCYPENKINGALSILQGLLPGELSPCPSLLEAGLSALNAIMHPAVVLLNVGWVESTKGDFYFYKEGVSTSVGKLLDKIDLERIEIGRHYGLVLDPFVSVVADFYGGQFSDVGEFARNTVPHNSIKDAPGSTSTRYITEDVAYILVPWYLLAQAVGLEVPTIKLIIDLAATINDVDYLATGRHINATNLLNKCRM